jgi:hypothetical protein
MQEGCAGAPYGGRMASRSPRSVSIELLDGRLLDAGPPVAAGQPVRVRPLARLAPRFFDACPICASPATEDEHVPPQSMGGKVMTRTCAPCNNGLGSNVEADLADWHDDALTLPAFSGDAVRGTRHSSRLLCRTTPKGEPVLIVDRGFDPAVRDLLLSGKVDLTACVPDENRVRIALLKHAFLAACLRIGLLGPEGDIVRRDLIAARDAASRRKVRRSDLALGLTLLRADDGSRLDFPVVYSLATDDEETIHGVVLGGTTFVSWHSYVPSDRTAHRPTPPRRQFNVSLSVGDPLEGVVRAVDRR